MALVAGFIDSNEKEGSDKNESLECKEHTQFNSKMTKIDTPFLTKMPNKRTISSEVSMSRREKFTR